MNTVLINKNSNVVKDSYLKNCIIKMDENQKESMFVDLNDGTMVVHLDNYAIIPKSDYVQLSKFKHIKDLNNKELHQKFEEWYNIGGLCIKNDFCYFDEEYHCYCLIDKYKHSPAYIERLSFINCAYSAFNAGITVNRELIND